MTGFAGQKGTAQLASDREEWLLGHFPASIVYAAKTLDRDYEPPEECVPEARVKISFGGVTAALWILGEKLQTGLAVDLRAVPIRQEMSSESGSLCIQGLPSGAPQNSHRAPFLPRCEDCHGLCSSFQCNNSYKNLIQSVTHRVQHVPGNTDLCSQGRSSCTG